MPIVLLIGAGPKVGQATAEAFANAAYTVVIASRSTSSGSKYNHFAFDASKPDTVRDLFSRVRQSVGIPSVVIYNAYANTATETPFEIPIDTFCSDMNVNATSPWAAAGEAVKCFEELGTNGLGSEGGTFIFTGNVLNESAGPNLLTFGMGKSATAQLIQHLAVVSYPSKPYKFYYGDERHPDGAPMYTGISGPAHGKLYLELAQDPKQRPWQQTFVNGKGYTKFPVQDVWYPPSS